MSTALKSITILMTRQNKDDIPMTSPDFRHAFSKIREELLRQNKNVSNCWNPNKANQSSKKNSTKQLHGIVPALIVASTNSCDQNRTHQVGTFFVGSEILELRLKHICSQFTDNQVVFDFNSIIVGEQYQRRYSN